MVRRRLLGVRCGVVLAYAFRRGLAASVWNSADVFSSEHAAQKGFRTHQVLAKHFEATVAALQRTLRYEANLKQRTGGKDPTKIKYRKMAMA